MNEEQAGKLYDALTFMFSAPLDGRLHRSKEECVARLRECFEEAPEAPKMPAVRYYHVPDKDGRITETRCSCDTCGYDGPGHLHVCRIEPEGAPPIPERGQPCPVCLGLGTKRVEDDSFEQMRCDRCHGQGFIRAGEPIPEKEPEAPKAELCECGHSELSHDRRVGDCWAGRFTGRCDCQRFRTRVPAAPTEKEPEAPQVGPNEQCWYCGLVGAHKSGCKEPGHQPVDPSEGCRTCGNNRSWHKPGFHAFVATGISRAGIPLVHPGAAPTEKGNAPEPCKTKGHEELHLLWTKAATGDHEYIKAEWQALDNAMSSVQCDLRDAREELRAAREEAKTLKERLSQTEDAGFWIVRYHKAVADAKKLQLALAEAQGERDAARNACDELKARLSARPDPAK